MTYLHIGDIIGPPVAPVIYNSNTIAPRNDSLPVGRGSSSLTSHLDIISYLDVVSPGRSQDVGSSGICWGERVRVDRYWLLLLYLVKIVVVNT